MKAERKWKMVKRIAVIVFIMGITLLAACSDTKTVSNQGEHDSQEEAEKTSKSVDDTSGEEGRKRKQRKNHLNRLSHQKMRSLWKINILKKKKKCIMTNQNDLFLLGKHY